MYQQMYRQKIELSMTCFLSPLEDKIENQVIFLAESFGTWTQALSWAPDMCYDAGTAISKPFLQMWV